MPAVVIPVIAAVATPAVATAIGGGLLATAFATALVSGASSLVLGGIQRALAPSRSSGSSSGIGGLTSNPIETRDIARQIRQPITTRKMVYGEARVSGPIVFIEQTGNNKFLHMCIVLADHEVQEIGEVWIDDYPITDDMLTSGLVNTGRYQNLIRIKKHLGNQTTADSDLVSETSATETDIGYGCAYIYARLEFDKDVFPNGVPNISAWVKGKKVLDTRDSVTRWTPNIALMANDFLIYERYGFGATSAELNNSQTTAAANIADEIVTTANKDFSVTAVAPSTDIITLEGDLIFLQTGDRVELTGTPPTGLSTSTNYYVIVYQRKTTPRIKLANSLANALAGTAVDFSGSGTSFVVRKTGEPRYHGGGVLDSETEPKANLEDILSGMAGRAVYSGGSWKLQAGAYSAPTVTLDEGHVVSGISAQTRVSRNMRFNTISGTYVSPINNGQPTNYPSVTNATYVTADNGVEIIRDMNLPFTQRPHTAQRIAKIELEKARQEIAFTADFKLHALQLQCGDNVQISNTNFGWSSKIFEVTNWQINLNSMTVNMSLRETATTVYDWNNGEETAVDPAANTNLPDPFTVLPPGAPVIVESLFSSRNGGGVKAKADITATASQDFFVSQYQFRYKLLTDTDYITRAPVTEPTDTLFDIVPGVYTFECRAINSLGVASEWEVTSPFEIFGLSAPPSDLTGLNIQAISSFAILRWTQSTDLDVTEGGKIVFRHQAVDSGAAWNESVSIGEAIPGGATEAILPLKAGAYLARPYDSSGIPSASPTIVYTKGATIVPFANIDSITENPTFAGTKTQCSIDDSQTPDVLRISGSGLFDDIPDFDAIGSLDSYGGIYATATYDFASGIDLGSVDTVRLESNIKARIVNEAEFFDSRLNNIDDWASFDGDNTTADGDCQIWVRETDDNPAGSPTWSEWQRLDVGEYTARAFDFQARLSVRDSAYNIYVEELGISVDQ